MWGGTSGLRRARAMELARWRHSRDALSVLNAAALRAVGERALGLEFERDSSFAEHAQRLFR